MRSSAMSAAPGLALGLAILFGAGAPARADGRIFLCVDANGHKELTDIDRKTNCKALDLPGALTAPARKPATPAAPARPNGAVAPAPAVPASFPKVDSAEQRARDADRRQILQDELRSEEARLAELKKEYNNGEPERQGNERNYAKYLERVAQLKDNIGRAEKNVEALKREIANIR